MKKKNFLTFFVSAVALVAIVPVMVMHSVDGTPSAKMAKSAETDIHNITVSADSTVTVTVASTASAGQIVDFTLTYDAEIYKIDSVMFNDVTPMQIGDNYYKAIMGDGDAVITVRSSFADPDYGKFSITNLKETDGVVLIGAPMLSLPGNEISFKIGFTSDSPYTYADKISVTGTETNNNYDVSVLSDGTHKFVMPEEDVEIDLALNKKSYLLSKPDVTFNYSKAWVSEDEGETWESIYLPDLVKVDSLVKIGLTDTASEVAKGIKMHWDGQEILCEEESDEVVFKMPNHAVKFDVLTDVNYKPITLVPSEHISITLLDKVESEEGVSYVEAEDNLAIPTNTVYFSLTISDENYLLDEVKVTYNETRTAYVTTEDEESHIYSFTMQNYDDVTITVKENVLMYSSYSFNTTYHFGNVYGLNNATYSKHNTASLSSSNTFVNDGTEKAAFKGTSYSIDEVTGTEDSGMITMTSGSSTTNLGYSSTFAIKSYSTKLLSEQRDDIYIGYKIPEGYEYSDFKLHYLTLNYDRTGTKPNFFIVQIVNNDSAVPLDAMIFDAYNDAENINTNAHRYLSGITLEIEGATLINDKNATKITIKQNGSVIFIVESVDSLHTITKV